MRGEVALVKDFVSSPQLRQEAVAVGDRQFGVPAACSPKRQDLGPADMVDWLAPLDRPTPLARALRQEAEAMSNYPPTGITN